MFNSNNNKKIKICILEMSSQNRSILEFFFENAGKSLFEESTVENAQAFIIDYDYPGALESLDELDRLTQISGIITSIKEVSRPSAVWIAKPITSKALIEAQKKLADLIKVPAPRLVPKPQEVEVKAEPLVKVEEAKPSLDAGINVLIDEISDVNEESIEMLDEPSVDASMTTLEATKALAVEEESTVEFIAADNFTIEMPAEVVEKSKSHSVHKEPQLATAGFDDFPETIDFDIEARASEPQSKAETIKPQQDTIEPILELIDLEEPKIDSLLDSLIADTEATGDEPIEKGVTELPQDDANLLLNDVSEDKQQSDFDFDLDLELDFDSDEPKKEVESSTEELDDLLTTDMDLTFPDLDTDDSKPVSSDKSIHEEVENSINDLSELISENANLLSPELTTTDSKDTDLEAGLVENIELSMEDSLQVLPDSSIQEQVVEPNNESKNIEDLDVLDPVNLPENKSTLAELDQQDIAKEDDNLLEESLVSEVDLEVEQIPAQDMPAKTAVNSNDNEKSKSQQELKLAEEELESLLEEIRGEAEEASDNFQYDIQGKNNHTITNAESRWALTCGSSNEPYKKGESTYKQSEHLIGTFLKVLERAKKKQLVMRLKFGDVIIVIDSEIDTVYCDPSIYGDAYADVCFNAFDQSTIKVHSLDESEIRLYRKLCTETEPESAHSIESFIWTTGLLTSRGRLPEGTNIRKPVGLKYWPNLTRIEKIPNVMQIAAVFYKHPGSLVDISNWLSIEKNYIYSFYSAVLALNMLDSGGKIQALTKQKKKALKKSSNRGFFSRLLKRINT